jgi:hypothetical protein
LWGAKSGTPEGDHLDVLATLIEAYEEEHHPIDPPDPVEVYDSGTIGGIGAANQIGMVPNAAGVILFDWPCLNGLVFVPGTGQVAAVSFT